MENRVVLVQDAMPYLGGAEQVLAALLEVYPAAPIYTLVFNQERFERTVFEGRAIHSSFVSRLPGARRDHHGYLPLLPLAVERFDLTSYPLVLSFNYAVAHGVVTRPDQLHISYTYTPLRYAWQHYHAYLTTLAGPKRWLARLVLHYLRLWDFAASQRVDHFVAISGWVARCVWRAYRRRAAVIYPPVDVEAFQPLAPREDYYVTVTRLAPHKKVSLIAEAFARLGRPLYVVGEGAEYRRLAERAPANIQMLGWQPRESLVELLGRAKAFVHMAEEDFGIAPVEAQAAGCPVIAYGRGGVRETVIAGRTGLFFAEQSAESLIEAVERFERLESRFEAGEIRGNAERFAKERFQREFTEMVERKWERFIEEGWLGPG